MNQQSTSYQTNLQKIPNGQQNLSSPLCMFAQDLQKLKQKYKNFKQKNAHKYKSIHPIILKHFYDRKSQFADIPEFILIICSKQMQVKYIVPSLVSLIKKKWKIQSQSIYVYNSKGKYLLGCNEGNIGDLLKQLKYQEEFIQWKYTFSSQIIQGDIGGLIYVHPIIIIAAVPVLIYIEAQKAVLWTYNKLPTLIKVSAASKFKQQYSFQQRVERSKKTLSDNPFMLPLIIEKHQLSTLPQLPNNQILVQPLFNFQKFRYMITKKIINKQQANFSIYFYLSGRLPNQNSTIKETYQKYKDKDGFLYVTYQEQESF